MRICLEKTRSDVLGTTPASAMKPLETLRERISPPPGGAALPNPRTKAVEDAVALLVLFAATIVSANVIDFQGFSDDQKSYIRIATDIVSQPVPWIPSDSFAWILATLYRLCGDWPQTFTFVYGLFAGLYMPTAYACLRSLRLRPAPALAATLISMVPHYTLGMTFWGFAGAEFVTARITIIPMAALLLTAFLRNRDSQLLPWLFPAAAAASFLHLSSAFLFAILIVAYGVVRAGALRRALAEAVAPMFVSAVLFAALAYRQFLVPSTAGLDVLLLQIYEQMASVQGTRLDGLDPEGALELLWRAAYAGFWWTMFPPRLSDIAYVLGENALILAAVWLAWTRCFRPFRDQDSLASRLAALAIGVGVTAYGFQAANFIAWKLIGAPPRIFEEVRAFGFLYWPIYVAIGFAFQRCGTCLLKGLLFAALLVSPTMAVRKLPEAAKATLRSAALRYGPVNLNPEYLEKALGRHAATHQELERLTDSLRLVRQGAACRIIGLEHELKRSGCAVFVSYQDKRAGRLGFAHADALLIWYLSYEEIRVAIESGDPDRIVAIAGRYGANMVILPREIRDPRFGPVFSGTHWHAYRIVSVNESAASAP